MSRYFWWKGNDYLITLTTHFCFVSITPNALICLNILLSLSELSKIFSSYIRYTFYGK